MMFIIRNVDVVQNKKNEKKPSKCQIYEVTISSTDGLVFSISRSYEDFTVLRKEINGLLIANENSDELPNLPGGKSVRWFDGKKEEEKRKKAVTEFCQEIVKLPESVIRSTTVYDFFTRDCTTLIDRSAEHNQSGCSLETNHQTDSQRLTRTPRVHAYEEIDVQGERPALLNMSTTESNNNREVDNGRVIYASVVPRVGVQASQVTPPSRPSSVEYAEVTSRTVASESVAARSIAPEALPVINEQYCNASEISSSVRLLSNRESGNYTGALRSETVGLGPRASVGLRPQTTAGLGPQISVNGVQIQQEEKKLNLESEVTCHLSRGSVKLSDSVGTTEDLGAPEIPDKSRLLSNTSSSSSTNHSVSDICGSPVKSSGSRRRRNKPASSDDSQLVPPPPQVPPPPSPSLTDVVKVEGIFDEVVGGGDEVRVVAVASYSSPSASVLSFERGARGVLMSREADGWWCVKLADRCGWVPAQYFRIVQGCDGGGQWFSTRLTRGVCEELLMKHGEEGNFAVRESVNRVGSYALSVKHNDRIHHFPIELTRDNKYNIGQHDFKSITNIIVYYKKSPLFYDDSGQGVTLGNPIVIAADNSSYITLVS